jgi:CDP-paratose 2-epimerase
MRTIIVTGSAGSIGSETVRRFAKEGARVVGIDNDMRARVFWQRGVDQKDT